MLDKKYIFETEKSRLVRLIISITIVVCFVSACLVTICASIPYFAYRLEKQAEAHLFNKSPDLIAIFTGGAGRIAFGLEIAKKYPNAKVYISGVYNKNTIETIYAKQVRPNQKIALEKLEQSRLLEQEEMQIIHNEGTNIPETIDIDYEARNTIENVFYTFHYLRQEYEHQNILIISSDYHIPRIKWLIDSMIKKHEKFEFNYIGMKTDFGNFTNLKHLLTEAVKLTQAFFLIISWDRN
ncbi:MAG: YdcF family protein [Bacteriovoracaceae bacterium]|nr:YdcF family protein [Bacteriovoracaceae bacterium]